jgi:hypothetical protein
VSFGARAGRSAATIALAGLGTVAVSDRAAGQVAISTSALVSFVRHQVDIGYGTEHTSGPALGIVVTVAPTHWLEVQGMGYGGTLNADSGATAGRRMTDIELRGSAFVTPWLAFQLMTGTRSYSTPLATQHWTLVQTGGQAIVPMFDGAARAIFRLALVPVASASGLPSADLGVAGATGIEFLRAPLTGSLLLSLERYDFPAGSSMAARHEEVAMLGAQLGVRFLR